MATGAGLAEWEQTHGKKKAKYVLTSTGLLMEGLVRTPRKFSVSYREDIIPACDNLCGM